MVAAKRPPAQESPAKEAPQKSASQGLLRKYLRQSSRPLVSLVFVLPLLVLYEGGVLLLGPQAVRNGADVWLRQFLDIAGFGQYFLLPALTVGLLLAWHHLTRDRWQVEAAVVYVMFVECALLGLGLVGIGRVQGVAAQWLAESGYGISASATTVALAYEAAPLAGRLVGFLGAGVYEEMLFRLMLLPPLAWVAWRLGAKRGLRLAAAVILTSLVFSAAHYVGPHGEAYDSFTFAFRFIAGAMFAVLFVSRGFGVAAGTHALYDVFVGFG